MALQLVKRGIHVHLLTMSLFSYQLTWIVFEMTYQFCSVKTRLYLFLV